MLRFARSTARSMARLAIIALPAVAAGAALTGCARPVGIAPEGTTVAFAILATTDLHQNVLGYNYYALAPDASFGLDRTATLLAAARREHPNNLLVDDGDATQGTLLGDFQAVGRPIPCAQTLAIYRVMNALGYDGAGLGNHEFNYGLPFLSQTLNRDFGVPGVARPGDCGAPTYPVVNANVHGVASRQPILPPYALVTKSFTGTTPDGRPVTVPVKFGLVGFVPPRIMDWDAKHLEGKVYADGVMETARKVVPDAKQAGADVVVALSHGGIDASPYSPRMENASYWLTTVPGIDAVVAGHAHLVFPAPAEPNGPALDPLLAVLPADRVDFGRGLVNGVPVVMAQSWGRRLGIIRMRAIYTHGAWVIDRTKSGAEARGFKHADGANAVAPDPSIAALIDAEHKAAIAYAQLPLGTTTDFGMSAYFALAGDVSAIQIVNQAQVDYVRTAIATSNDPALQALRGVPVISCSAPFKAGRNGPADFTDVAPGASPAAPAPLQVRNPGDLYVYGNNNLHAVRIKGADLKGWLETSARQFARIDPAATAPQDLVPVYTGIFNFDVFYADDNALTYRIDVTQPAGARIVDLQYQGRPIDPAADFVVATNDYRAGGGGRFPGLDGSRTILRSPDANQAVVAEFLKRQPALTRARNGAARSWSFVKVKTAGPVFLRSTPGKLAIARAAGLDAVVAEGPVNASGYATYTIDLSR